MKRRQNGGALRSNVNKRHNAKITIPPFPAEGMEDRDFGETFHQLEICTSQIAVRLMGLRENPNKKHIKSLRK